MDKNILKKIERFIYLSSFFTKSEENVLGKNTEPLGNVIFTAICAEPAMYTSSSQVDGREIYIDGNNYIKAIDNKPVSRSEKILFKAKVEAKVADDYDEYISLQENLTEYFKITNKLK